MQCLLRMIKSADSARRVELQHQLSCILLQDESQHQSSFILLQDESVSADLNFFQDVQHLEKV